MLVVFSKGGHCSFYDVRVFNPFAKSHLNQKLDTAFRSNENEKKRQYNQRVLEVEYAWFLYSINLHALILAELALKLSGRKQVEHSMVIHWLRAKLSFNLLRSAVLCLRGSRTIKQEVNYDVNSIEILYLTVLGRIV